MRADDDLSAPVRNVAGILPIHFLHIGKTGGSALRGALEPFAKAAGLVFHPHAVTLADIPEQDRVVFFARHPISRFVSAFNSRLREGRPRYNIPWHEQERIAFERFPTPNSLAEAIGNDANCEVAAAAMGAIRHLRWPLSRWLGDRANLEHHAARIFFIGFQESLAADFERLKARLGVPDGVVLPDDPVLAHVTPGGHSTNLSATAIANLSRWYAADLELFRFLCEFRASVNAGSTPAVANSAGPIPHGHDVPAHAG